MTQSHMTAQTGRVSRRDVLRTLGAGAGLAAIAGREARAQAPGAAAAPREDNPPTRHFEPASRFHARRAARHLPGPRHHHRSIRRSTSLRLGNTPIQRLWTGGLWCEGPAWCEPGPLSGLERHSEQPPAALSRR